MIIVHQHSDGTSKRVHTDFHNLYHEPLRLALLLVHNAYEKTWAQRALVPHSLIRKVTDMGVSSVTLEA